jgi:Spy/CpxP family protein refolding chaperone
MITLKTNSQIRLAIIWAFVVLAFLATANAQTQTQTQPNPSDATPAQANQPNQGQDVIGALGLTPEQIQKWRAINADLRIEQQSATMRVRQAKRALAEAVESPNSNEDLIKQRAKELSDAQAANTQLFALKEARILQVLTPDQRIRLREIRRQNQEAIRAANQQRRGMGGRQNGLRNNNPNAPLRPNQQRKILRQQLPKN